MDNATECKRKVGRSYGPYPTIDLSSVFASKSNCQETKSNDPQLLKTLKEACNQYGCFHVNINPQSFSQQSHDSLSILSDEAEVKNLIESLFEKDFVQEIQGGNTHTPSVSFFQGNDDDNHQILNATYRGRSAESGSEKSSANQGEPKQSWEISRCSSNLIGNDEISDKSSDTDIGNVDNSRLQVLQTFIRALHEVVVLLCSEYLLDLPEDKFVCTGSHKSKNLMSKDLLRVFRYDALSTAEEQLSNLGSSSHTDWGCMTVVWQDSKGGLQIYCHERNCWNDVEVDNERPNESSMIRLFIHVGDYLSLAMNAVKANRKNEKNADTSLKSGKIGWPSPTHRVICPLRMKDDDSEANNSRCSLVYFAYPPNGVSLSDAIISLGDTDYAGRQHTGSTNNEEFPYSRYMLLSDQSAASEINDHKSPDKIAQETLKKILYTPFDEVIQDKWNQVQRT
jgi:isopenicillin N synthase-like dioxygenase